MHYFIPVCLHYFNSLLKHLLSFRHQMSSHTEGIQIIYMFNIIQIGLPKGYMFVSLHYVSVTAISFWHLLSLYCWLSHSYTWCSHILFSILNVKQTFQGFHINLNLLPFSLFFQTKWWLQDTSIWWIPRSSTGNETFIYKITTRFFRTLHRFNFLQFTVAGLITGKCSCFYSPQKQTMWCCAYLLSSLVNAL